MTTPATTGTADIEPEFVPKDSEMLWIAIAIIAVVAVVPVLTAVALIILVKKKRR